MKNTPVFRFGTMLLLGIAALASCQRLNDSEAISEMSFQEMTVKAGLASTRTANRDASTIWLAEDAISVIHCETGGSDYYSSRFSYTGEDQEFKGRVKNVSESNSWFTVYPYREDNVSAEAVHVTVPSPQTQTGNDNRLHAAGEGFPLYGRSFEVPRSEDVTIFMRNTLTLVRSKVKNITDSPIVVTKIEFTAPREVTGDFTGDLTDPDEVVWNADEGASAVAVLNVAEGAEIEAAAESNFYIGAMPFSVAPGGQLKFKITAVHPTDPTTEIVFYRLITLTDGATFASGVTNTFGLSFDDQHSEDPGEPQNPDVPQTKKTQELTFAETSVSIAFVEGGTYELSGFSGAKTTVTWSSEDETVATVSNGVVTMVAPGTTVITAKAAETSEYYAAQASMTLTLTESQASTSRTYVYQSSISEGTYLICGYESSQSGTSAKGFYVCQFPKKSDNLCDHILVTSDPDITSFTTEDSSIIGSEVEISASGSSYLVKVKDNGQYMYYANSAISYTDNASSAAQTISKSSNKYWVMKTGNYEFYHSGTNQGFTYVSNKSANNLKFFKLDSSKESQNLSFAQTSMTLVLGQNCEIGGSYDLPALSGARTSVTWSSSNTSVATVASGKITVVGKGTTTITAKAAETDAYSAGEASVTVTIREASSVTGSAYVKVTAEPDSWDGTYLIVDESAGKAFAAFEANASSYAVDVTISDGMIAAGDDVDKYALTITDAGVDHGNSSASGRRAYNLQNSDGKYLYASSGSITISDTNSRTSSGLTYTYYHAFKYDGGVQVLSANNASGGYAYYLGYASSAFGYSRESASGRRVELYKFEGDASTVKKSQSLSFGNQTVTWYVGDNAYKIGDTEAVQSVSGAKTAVSYTSSNSAVATVSNTTVTITGLGTTTITATAEADDEYYSATKSYTLVVKQADQESVYNLENDSVKQYFDYVEANPYNPSDYSYSYVSNYISGKGSNNRLDFPKPVPVSWTNPSSGNSTKTVVIYNDEAHTDVEMTVSVSSSSDNAVDVYNLIPGRTYYYVVNNGNAQIASGSFATTGRRRMMKVSTEYSQNHANNCRDLGGQVTTSGKTIKYGLIYRGTNMDSTTSDEQAILKNYMGIELDVDLRESSGKNPLGVTVSDKNYNSMSNLTDPDRMGTTLNDIMNAVANGKHVYIHCAVGADRTGFVCMVLEGLLGVPQNMCDVDYELTSFSVVGTRERTASSSSWGSGGSVNYYYSGSGKGVTYINDTYSGNTFQEKVVNFAKAMGVTEATIMAFQNNMLE